MAVREAMLSLRVSKQEMATIGALAQAEKLPTGALVRRLVLLEAEKRGITVPAEQEAPIAVTE